MFDYEKRQRLKAALAFCTERRGSPIAKVKSDGRLADLAPDDSRT
jgi:hypothetical protein